jgi:hypothetical protein
LGLEPLCLVLLSHHAKFSKGGSSGVLGFKKKNAYFGILDLEWIQILGLLKWLS